MLVLLHIRTHCLRIHKMNHLVLSTVSAGRQFAGKGGGNEAPQQADAGECEREARLPPPMQQQHNHSGNDR
jgi:hypothetical protein